jgi:hypothetical protein
MALIWGIPYLFIKISILATRRASSASASVSVTEGRSQPIRSSR